MLGLRPVSHRTAGVAAAQERKLEACPTKINAGYYLGGYFGLLSSPPETLNPSVVTHPIYSFMVLDEAFNIIPQEGDFEIDMWKRFVKVMKEGNPCTKPMYAVGGWGWSTSAQTLWRGLTATPASRAIGSANMIALARQYGFEGIDLVRIFRCRFRQNSRPLMVRLGFSL